MKPGLNIFLAASLIAGSVSAGVLAPVNPSRSADVNGKKANLPTLQLNRLSYPTRSLPVSPVTGQRVSTSTVPTDKVKLPAVPLSTVQLPVKSCPRTNFSAKRAVGSSDRVVTDTVQTGRAAITNRVIEATTADGNRELREQLNRRPINR